jgi:hypothetical protein
MKDLEPSPSHLSLSVSFFALCSMTVLEDVMDV